MGKNTTDSRASFHVLYSNSIGVKLETLAPRVACPVITVLHQANMPKRKTPRMVCVGRRVISKRVISGLKSVIFVRTFSAGNCSKEDVIFFLSLQYSSKCRLVRMSGQISVSSYGMII